MAKQEDKNKSVTKNDTNTVSGKELLPEGITFEELIEYWDVSNNEYVNTFKKMQLLDAADRGQLWKTIAAKFPSYQVLPETNHINYIKENLLASIYSVGKSAMLLPRRQEDVEQVNALNSVASKLWASLQVKTYQRKAGERAALLNIGLTQVGWKNSIIGGTTNFLYKGDVVLKNIDPKKFMRDPFADCAANGKYEMTWDDYHISKIKSTPVYKARVKILLDIQGENFGTDVKDAPFVDTTDRAKDNKSAKNYHRVTTYWVRDDKDDVYEIHMLNNTSVLYVNKLFLKEFPIVELYCNEPGNDLVGVSEPTKVFSNYVAYNMLNSIVATHAYKAQRPPRFVNTQSGINVRQFAKYGADADKTFLVNGNASEAVHYGKFPDLPPELDILSAKLDFDIKDKSGIDDVYAGKDFGSVTTTGGTDNVIARSTGRDLIKIQLYEEYTARLTMLIFQFYIKYGDKRTYAVKDATTNIVKDVVVDFTKIADSTKFDSDLTIQSELPKSKMRLAQMGNLLLEKQAQYKMNPEIITNEEWLMTQDIPFKDLIMSRIGIQRNTKTIEEVTQILFQFAGLIEQGMDPEQALQMVTETMDQQKQPTAEMQQGGMPNAGAPALGNTPNVNSMQQRQME